MTLLAGIRLLSKILDGSACQQYMHGGLYGMYRVVSFRSAEGHHIFVDVR